MWMQKNICRKYTVKAYITLWLQYFLVLAYQLFISYFILNRDYVIKVKAKSDITVSTPPRAWYGTVPVP